MLKNYTDADCAGDKRSRKSTSINLFLLGQNPIQRTRKDKHFIFSVVVQKLDIFRLLRQLNRTIWFIKFPEYLNLPKKLLINLYQAKQSCIKTTKSVKYHRKIHKTYWLQVLLIQYLMESGIIDLKYCPTNGWQQTSSPKPFPNLA